MMKNLRIVETVTTAGTKVTKEYHIQYKYLWWYRDLLTSVNYHMSRIRGAYGREVAFVHKRLFIFSSREEADQHLQRLKGLYRGKYNGDEIVEVISNLSKSGTIFMNLNRGGWLGSKFGYEYRYDINDLHEEIDRRKPLIRKKVVCK